MKEITIEVTETYKYQVRVNADTYTEALNNIKNSYENSDPEYDGIFTATANSHNKTTFKVIKENSRKWWNSKPDNTSLTL